MSQRDRRLVPRLDLAPKLKRPLSLWNPLDYLRLLYWVFFFPQALRWYVEEFGGGFLEPHEMTLRKGWDLLRQNPIQRQFLLQGLVLTVITPLTLGAIFQRIGVPVNWSVVAFVLTFSVVSLVMLSIASGVGLSVALSVALSVVGGVALGIGLELVNRVLYTADEDRVAWSRVWILLNSVTDSLTGGVVLSVASGIMWGVVLGVVLGRIWGVKGGVVFNLALGIVKWGIVCNVVLTVCFSIAMSITVSLDWGVELWGVAWGVVVSMVLSVVMSMVLSVSLGVGWSVGLGVMIFRPENWLLGLPLALWSPQTRHWQFPHVTPLPLPSLFSGLKNWLRQDWETGLHNANQLLAYTLQFTLVIRSVNRVLAETPLDLVISRVAQLAETPYDWQLVRFASASLSEAIQLEMLKNLFFLPRRWQRSLQVRFVTETRLDTPARAAAAGFWHLYKSEPLKAANAFDVVIQLPYGKEMSILALTLSYFETRMQGGTDNAPQMPEPPLLRSATWKAIARLHRVDEDIRVVERSVSRSTRSFALNRALGELTDLLKEAHALPEAEGGLIAHIADTWLKNLLEIAGEIGEFSITEPVRNPYVVGDPVEGNLFVGREDVLSQLEELWVMGQQLQSIVLYGHRRMGKTSILKNSANCLGASITVVYVNLLSLGNISQGVGEMLMAISDEIAMTVNIPAPDDADLLNLPYRTFERYLKQVDTQLGEKGLIIALDEFEQIEEFIADGQIHQDFIKFLRGLVQMSSKVAFVFAGLHTLEEMTEDYFHPFFASIIPIHVGFLTLESTHQLLANPTEDFPLDYIGETLDRIYALTAGQPYLIQLVGFWLVRRYNNQVFEQRSPRDPVFTVEDVEAIINDPKFYKQGRYYFTGVWSQAEQGAYGQQAILKAITPHPEGLSMDALAQATGMEEETLHKALETLKRHDVIQETERRWHIIVELFRRWVLDL